MNLRFVSSLILTALICLNIQAQRNEGLKDSLVLDPSIRYGQLENGFTYYIKPVKESGKKVSMEFLVKAGSKNEADDQYAMAHFLEHIPFTRTKNFINIEKDNQLLSDLQMRTTDIRGKTGGEGTIYSFDYPSGNERALTTGLLFFQDIASGHIEFQQKDIDGERGSFIEEYFFRGGSRRNASLQITAFLSNCIKGVKTQKEYQEYIQNFDIKPLKRFYRDWYRPELMALTVVGDIKNVDTLEKMIKSSFTSIKGNNNSIKQIDCRKEYLLRENQFTVVTDSLSYTRGLQQTTDFQFYLRTYEKDYMGLSGINSELMEFMLLKLIEKRFNETVMEYNIPYNIYAAPSTFLPALKITVKAQENYEKDGIQKAFSIVHEIRKNGFTREEFRDQKNNVIENLVQKDTSGHQYWIKEINDHFFYGKALPQHKPIILAEFVKQLPLNEFNSYMKEYLPEMPQDIAVLLPKERKKEFSENEIKHWIKESNNDIENYIPKKYSAQLLSQEHLAILTPKRITLRGTDNKENHQLVLENGIKLILKPFKPTEGSFQDKIMIHGFSPQGASLFPEEDFFSATLAPEIIKHSGVGDLDKFELENFLESTSLPPFGLRHYITYFESGIEGEVELTDLEIALQLIYLYMTDPRWDIEAFKDWKRKEENDFLNPKVGNNIKADFLNEIHRTIGDNSFTPMGTVRFHGAKELDLKKAEQIHRSLMGNPENFTFIVTGDYTLNQVLPLLKKYLGSIPRQERKTETTGPASKPQKFPKRPFEKIYYPESAIENAHVYLTYLRKVKDGVSVKEEIESNILAYILGYEIQKLRYENKRAVYLAAARNQITRENQYHRINLILSSGIEDLPKVKNDLQEIVSQLKTRGVSQNLFQQVMESYIIPMYSKTKRNQNKQVQQELYEHYRHDVPFRDQNEIMEIIQSIKREDISKIAQKYLKNEYLMEFVAQSDTSS